MSIKFGGDLLKSLAVFFKTIMPLVTQNFYCNATVFIKRPRDKDAHSATTLHCTMLIVVPSLEKFLGMTFPPSSPSFMIP